MSKYSIDSTTLTNIANAIRAKDGSSSPIVVSDFATKINNIPITSSGDGEVNFLSPYNANVSFYSKMGTAYLPFSVLIIPYDVWSQYHSITFNYVLMNRRSPQNDIYGSYANIELYLGKFNSVNTWSDTYNAETYSNTDKIITILQDFCGRVSDTYTINCDNITISKTDYNNILIVVKGKVYSSSDSSSNLIFKLGNFTGVKK